MPRKPVSVPLNGAPQGILVDTGSAYRFVAVKFDVFALDGRAFSSVEEAEREIARALEQAPQDAEADGLVA